MVNLTIHVRHISIFWAHGWISIPICKVVLLLIEKLNQEM